ncbi:hypothetical protein [Desulfosporosinus nitroreducens]|uniref:hypothetical protein n=1 Tax=Desulfosporosinus nitroreducens TaxID=2018668 RepID=UPI00207D50F6|nr:hypothetical protein [Desulfosporosinus nitroreducens]MCO1599853.1 hypothetical protein [Desulfosporosinus nitroreducens]
MNNEFELALQKSSTQNQSTAVQTTIGRHTQDIQGLVFMAKQYPRNQFDSWKRIKEACSRKSLAEVASYTYPRGKEKITGPSIRLAEVLAQNWGNMSTGVVELEQKNGESTCMAFAWDLETNFRDEKIFTVKHERWTKNYGAKKLEDPRDIYEHIANMGARRQRACILAVIPKDVVDSAVEECDKTLAGINSDPIVDRIKKMLERFTTYGVTREMLEKRVGCKSEAFTEKDLVGLFKIYNSLKDGMGAKEDYFEVEKPPTTESKVEAEFKAEQERKAKEEFDRQESLKLDAELAEKEGK